MGIKEDVEKEAKALTAQVYNDAAGRSVRAVGNTAGSLLEALLTPLDAIASGMKAGMRKLVDKVQGKADQIPPDRQLPAPGRLAAQVALGSVLLGDDEEADDLRDLFANLLVSSLDKESASRPHPSFARMISDLNSDEAWLVKSVDKMGFAYVEAMNGGLRIGFACSLGSELGFTEDRHERALSSLERLGIIRHQTVRTPNDDRYPEFRTKATEAAKQRRPDLEVVTLDGAFVLTAIGVDFVNACVRYGLPPLTFD